MRNYYITSVEYKLSLNKNKTVGILSICGKIFLATNEAKSIIDTGVE
jgi:hypothetical protein